MANAPKYFSHMVPSYESSPTNSVYRFSTRVLCLGTNEGAERTSFSDTRVPKLISKGCKLVGCGSAVPKFQISNDDLAKIVDTSDEWISSRTGIRNRRVLTGKDSLTALATEAAKKALQMANVHPDDVDIVLLCSSTSDDRFSCAPLIAYELGCKRNPLAYDITAACSGFMLGLDSATHYMRDCGFKNALVIGADAVSRYVDWTDRKSCILFGDAAGAVIVQSCDVEDDGFLAFDLHSDGEGRRHISAPFEEIKVDHALGLVSNVRCVPQSIQLALEKAGLNVSSIDWFIFHQANQRIIDSIANRLELPQERVISNLANYGNTSAASIPLALDEAVRSGKVQTGHTIAIAGFGAGLIWGSGIIRWN